MRQLSGVDALHVLEETRNQHMHTIKIAILGPTADGPVSVDVIRAWARDRLPRISAMRWRVVKIPLGLGRPVFVDAGRFDVDPHLFVESAPSPGGDAQLDAIVSRIASVQLRRDRPLWELTVVTGLSGDRVALVFKIHHAIMDGQASVRFFELVFDGGDEDALRDPPETPEQIPRPAELVGYALSAQLKLYAQLPHVVRRTAASVRVNFERKRGGAAPVVNPMSGPATRFNRLPVPDRVYVNVTLPLEEIKATKAAAGCTINELFITLCGGAIRRYLEEKGELPNRCMNSACPVSIRKADERDAFGNRTSYWYVSLGTDVADPLERLAAVKDSLDAAREWAKGDTELFAVWQDYYLLFGTMTLKTLALAERLSRRPAFNAVVSNVRGPRPLTLGDAPVVAVRSMGPITRTLGLNLTAWSYQGDFAVGVQSCRDFLDDPERIGDHLRDELAAMQRQLMTTASPASGRTASASPS